MQRTVALGSQFAMVGALRPPGDLYNYYTFGIPQYHRKEKNL
jgi:hypothetical protein